MVFISLCGMCSPCAANNTVIETPSITTFTTASTAATPTTQNETKKDDDYPIEITSDTADFDDKTGDATHRGNCVVTQGTRHLTADKIIIHRNPDGKFDQMTAFGNPARFHAFPEPGKPILEGKGKTLKYFPAEEKLILEEEAELSQAEHILQGPLITYYLSSRVLSSESGPKQRTTVIIKPKEK